MTDRYAGTDMPDILDVPPGDAVSFDELEADAQEQQSHAQVVTLNDVQACAERQKLLEDEVEALEAQVDMKKSELRRVAEKELPDLLNAVGQTKWELPDGSVILLQDDIFASIGDENREAAHAWLRANNFEDLIKNVVSVTFGKGEDRDALLLVHNINVMADNDVLHFGTLDQKEVVHSATLKAFVKERVKSGQPLPADTFKLFVGQKCTIKKAKVKV